MGGRTRDRLQALRRSTPAVAPGCCGATRPTDGARPPGILHAGNVVRHDGRTVFRHRVSTTYHDPLLHSGIRKHYQVARGDHADLPDDTVYSRGADRLGWGARDAQHRDPRPDLSRAPLHLRTGMADRPHPGRSNRRCNVHARLDSAFQHDGADSRCISTIHLTTRKPGTLHPCGASHRAGAARDRLRSLGEDPRGSRSARSAVRCRRLTAHAGDLGRLLSNAQTVHPSGRSVRNRGRTAHTVSHAARDTASTGSARRRVVGPGELLGHDRRLALHSPAVG